MRTSFTGAHSAVADELAVVDLQTSPVPSLGQETLQGLCALPVLTFDIEVIGFPSRQNIEMAVMITLQNTV